MSPEEEGRLFAVLEEMSKTLMDLAKDLDDLLWSISPNYGTTNEEGGEG